MYIAREIEMGGREIENKGTLSAPISYTPRKYNYLAPFYEEGREGLGAWGGCGGKEGHHACSYTCPL